MFIIPETTLSLSSRNEKYSTSVMRISEQERAFENRNFVSVRTTHPRHRGTKQFLSQIFNVQDQDIFYSYAWKPKYWYLVEPRIDYHESPENRIRPGTDSNIKHA